MLGATGFIGAPYRAEIRECDEAIIVAMMKSVNKIKEVVK